MRVCERERGSYVGLYLCCLCPGWRTPCDAFPLSATPNDAGLLLPFKRRDVGHQSQRWLSSSHDIHFLVAMGIRYLLTLSLISSLSTFKLV